MGKMKKQDWTRVMGALCLLAVFWLTAPAVAEELFVANSPYKGVVGGAGGETRVLLSEISESLNIPAVEENGVWTLGDYPVKVTEEGGKAWVRLVDLPKALVRIVRNHDLGTVDVYLTDEVRKGPDRSWAGQGKLVVFYANGSPACRALDRSLEDIILANTIELIIVDIDFPKEENFRKYYRRFKGDKVPYFVVLDNDDKEIDNFTGFKTYPEILTKLKDAFSK